MAKNNAGKAWTGAHLLEMQKENTPTRLMAWKLGRTESAIRSKTADLISRSSR